MAKSKKPLPAKKAAAKKPKRNRSMVAKAVKSTLTAAERKVLKHLLEKAGDDALPSIEVPRLKVEGRKPKRNTHRAFWIDGVHAYLRRKKANQAIIERVDKHVKSGDYRHVRTSDDVEIYEISDTSPLRRRKIDMTELTDSALERVIVKYACKHDYKTYYDAVSELAHRIKSGIVQNDRGELIELRIMRRGGPTPMAIQQELKAIREKRTGSKIFLPPLARVRN
jgi:hypothetical protein